MEPQPIERLASGVSGLDTVLRGGFTKSGIHIIQGTPGTGKTTLANQLCYRHAADGGRAIYVTLLAETHARMLLHLGTMRFFDPTRLPEQITYLSGLNALESGGLAGLLTLLRREIRARNATVLILDGLTAAEEHAKSDTELKKFIQELQTQGGLYGCTIFLLTSGRGNTIPPEYTIVDGIIELNDVRYGSRSERGLFVRKHRGSDFLPGRHPFRITEEGMVIYPRIEAAFCTSTHPDPAPNGRVPMGVEGLDAMLNGGLTQTTVTGVLGPSGIGKTTLGLHFVAGSTEAEPGLFFGFYETPPRLLQQAESLGLGLRPAIEQGHLEILWQPQGENIQDRLAYRLLDGVRRRGVKRLFLDGLGGFMESSLEPDRLSRFFAVLANELRVRDVTALYSLETRDLLGPGLEVPMSGISSLAEGLIALRFLERHSSTRRVLSVVKMRGSGFDPVLQEFVITNGKGMSLVGPFENVEGLLSGFAREPRSPIPRFSGVGEQ